MLPKKSRLALCVVALLIIVLLNACTPPPDASTRGTFVIDPTFTDFFKQLGGEETLGPGISPSYTNEGITYQYVVSGLMAYNPSAIPLNRFRFAPIASTEWQINGLVEPASEGADLHYVNGHAIWEEVWSFYDQYSADIIGLPVTGVMVNDSKQRYEQYFEGIGFYRNYADSPGMIHLMPYGSWMCGTECQYRVSDSLKPSPSYNREFSATEQLFLQASAQLGYGFTGAPLVAPRLGADGNYEMVFENVVMYINPSDGSNISLRPIPSWLGIQTDSPQNAIENETLSFYQVSEGLGYNIPNIFIDYLANHGGINFSGGPINEYRSLSDHGYSQCFTNLCLEYHPNAPQGLLIRPHTLGIDYLNIEQKPATPGSNFSEALQVNAWEDYPLIPSGRTQVINIEAARNNAPVPGVEFSLVVKQPDGITITYRLNPTGEDGITRIELDPINGPNGAIVQYEVCVIGAVSPQVCFSKSYTIWDQ